VLVFFDWYDYTTLRSASVVFIDNVRARTFPHTSSSRLWIMSLLSLLFNYVDRSWAMGVEKKIIFCCKSQHWYQSRSMHSCTGTVRTHRGCVRWFSYCYPFICICSYLRHCWIASSPRATLRVLLRETGSTTDIRLIRYMWLGGCQFLLFSGYNFCNGEPLLRVKETITESPLWLHACRLRSISS
jgi:hypothetical protein